MIEIGMRQPADNSDLVREGCLPCEELAKLHAWYASAARPEGTAHLFGRVGLHVVGIDVRRAASHPVQDDRALASAWRRLALAGTQELRQRQPRQTERADREETPPADAVTQADRTPLDRQHGAILSPQRLCLFIPRNINLGKIGNYPICLLQHFSEKKAKPATCPKDNRSITISDSSSAGRSVSPRRLLQAHPVDPKAHRQPAPRVKLDGHVVQRGREASPPISTVRHPPAEWSSTSSRPDPRYSVDSSSGHRTV